MTIIQSYRDEVKKLNAQNAALRKQRDELLAALKWAKAALDRASAGLIIQRDLEDAYDIARDAIASVKESK